MSPRPVAHPFLLALPVRLACAFLSRSFFQPDETWQALEVAHRLVFGYGYLTWEWRPSASSVGGIRSPVYALLFVPVFWLARVVGAEGGAGLVLGPRLLQAVLGAWMDASTAKLARRLLGDRFANAALLCSVLSFFNAHVAARTFSNSAETALTVAAMAAWPWPKAADAQATERSKEKPATSDEGSLAKALALAAVATVMRPSNAVIWLVLGAHLLWSTPLTTARLSIMRTAVTIGSLAVAACTLIDTTFFLYLSTQSTSPTPTPRSLLDSITFTPYTFLLQNVLNSISLFYGSNTSHFYLSQALPFMTMTMLPFALHGLWISNRGPAGTARMVVGATVAVYSLLAHKEFRFVHPLLPVVNVFAANSLVTLASRASRARPGEVWVRVGLKKRHVWLLAVSLVPAVYLGAFHARGQNEVMDYLRDNGEVRSVGFLMPCHSTPWQSRMHRPDLETSQGSGEGGKAWFIGCEPPVLSQTASTYLDQTDFFYASPIDYLRTRFPAQVDPAFPPSPFVAAHLPPSPGAVRPFPDGDVNDLGWWHEWPSHIVCFDVLLTEKGGEVGRLLEEKGYGVERRLWNSHFHEDGRRRGDVVVLKWKG